MRAPPPDAPSMRSRSFGAGDEIMAEGDAPDALHVIWSGRAAAYAVDPETGRQLVFSIMGPGEVVGELALLSGGGERSASVRALEPTTALTIGRADFERMRRCRRDLDNLLIEVLRERALRLCALLHEAVYLDARWHVLAALAELAERAGHPGGHVVAVPLSQEELGDLAGTTRETVSRILGEARRAGLVRTGARRIEILSTLPVDVRGRTRRDFRAPFAALLDPPPPEDGQVDDPGPASVRPLSDSPAARRRAFAAGEVVFHESDAADSLHLVLSGRAAAIVGGPRRKPLMLGVVGRGEILGELGLLVRGGRRTATVRALEATETLCVQRRDFNRLRRRDRGLDELLIQTLRRRVLQLSDRLFETRHREVGTRVRRRLLELAGLYGAGTAGTVIPLRQADVAGLVGASRATVSPILTAEAAAGAIRIAPRRITVQDVRGLAERACR